MPQISYTKFDFVGSCSQKCHVLQAVGHVIFNLHLGAGHSVLCQMEGMGHVFSNHQIFNAPPPLPPPPTSVLFDQ